LSEHAFLEPSAKSRTTETIRAVEGQTSAELVVSVRRSADRHVATSLIFGGVVGAIVLVVMLVSPQAYDVRTIPLDTLLGFALAALACHFVPALKRRLTPKARRRAAAERAARAAFEDLGIAKTKPRSAIHAFVALLERTAVVIADDGVPISLLGEPYETRISALDANVAALDFEAFLATLAGMGPLLSSVLPRRPDDENELCDQVA
jgi:putative membrane protein